jgi:ribosome-binding protein aMBF1 (putative translation factor)
MSYFYQDWTPVVLKKNFKKNDQNDQNQKGEFTPMRKQKNPNSNFGNGGGPPAYKMEEEDYKPKIVTLRIARQIIDGRVVKGWNQDTLAKETHLPLHIIKTYEKPSENTIINHQYIEKISKILGIKINKN